MILTLTNSPGLEITESAAFAVKSVNGYALLSSRMRTESRRSPLIILSLNLTLWDEKEPTRT